MTESSFEKTARLLALDMMTADQREHFEERAAIYEFDAGMTREEAERRAASDALRAPLRDDRQAEGHRTGEWR